MNTYTVYLPDGEPVVVYADAVLMETITCGKFFRKTADGKGSYPIAHFGHMLGWELDLPVPEE